MRKPLIWIGVLYGALTFAFTYPFSLHLGSQLLAMDSDSLLVQWILAWDVHAFTHQPFHIFDANAFAPLPNTLAFAENLIGSALLAAPILWLTGNMVLALNVVAVLSIPLSGLGTYLLARRVNISEAGAILAGAIFAFSPPRFLRIEQFQLTTIQWMPFCLAFLHAYFDTGKPRHLRLALLFFSLQALTGGHGAAFLMTAVVALLVYRFSFGEPLDVTRRVKDVGVLGALALLPTVLVFLPYRTAQSDMGLARTLDGWGTTPSSFFASPSHVDSRILEWFPAWLRESPDAYLFPGWVPLSILLAGVIASVAASNASTTNRSPMVAARGWRRLATALETLAVVVAGLGAWVAMADSSRLKLAGITLLSVRRPWRVWAALALIVALRAIVGRRVPMSVAARFADSARRFWHWTRRLRDNHTAFYACVALACFWLLFGPPYGVWQYVYEWPILSFIRVPTRFILLGLLALAVLVGFAFDRLMRTRSARAQLISAFALTALCLVEFAAMPMLGREPGNEVPAIDRWLNTQPKPFTVAELPMAEPEDYGGANALNARYMLHSTAHWQKTVNGYSGLLPHAHQELFASMWQFPNADALSRMRAFGVTMVVVHDDFTVNETRSATDARMAPFADRLELLHEEADGRVYRLRR